MGIKTWFDEEQIKGNINTAMSKGIRDSAVVLVFLTSAYIKKASGLGPKGEASFCRHLDCPRIGTERSPLALSSG